MSSFIAPPRARDDYLDATMRGWIVNTAHKFQRRLIGWEVEDLVQEGLACYYKCRDRYVGKEGLVSRSGEPCRHLPRRNPDKTARQHFQSLVKTAFLNRIRDLLATHPADVECVVSDLITADQTYEQVLEHHSPVEPEFGDMGLLIKNAPREIKQLLELLVNDALTFSYRAYSSVPGRARLRQGRSKKRSRETNNSYFCRVLGLPPQDIVGRLGQYFGVQSS